MNAVYHAIEVVSPIILLLGLGKLFAYLGFLEPIFVRSANKLAYNILLPVLLFNAVSQADMRALFNGPMMLSGAIGTGIAFAVFLVLTQWLGFSHYQRGVVVQGSFRANMGIIGLALCSNLFGQEGLAVASVYLGIMVPVFNVLSVWVLVLFSSSSKRQLDIALQVLKSPLVIAIVFAIPISYWSIELPSLLTKTSSLLGQVTLPLALLCIGASLVFREFSTRWKPLCFIVVGKAFVYPAIVIALAMVLGVNGDALIVLVIMSLAPTATASFPAVQQLGGDAALAADAVAITTVLSLPLYLVVISML